MGTNLLGDSGAILTYLFTNLLERLPVIQTSLDVRTVFAIQMPILSHQVLLLWSEQQVVDQQWLLYSFFGRINLQYFFGRINFQF